jgi:predicted ATP-grasp superfamily ATP-dependent carboligase
LARILVLDGHSSAALAFTRSAGRAGHWIAVAANQGLFASAKLSRYCRLGLDYPSSTANSQAFVDSVADLARQHSIDLVIPITDWTLQPLSDHRDRLAGITRIALPPHRAVLAAGDKYQTAELARSQGINIPRTWLVKCLGDLDAITDATFPLVVKDRFSVRWREGKAIMGSVAYAFSKDDLRRSVEKRLRSAGDVLVQEFVPGTGVGVSFFITPEEMFIPFQWERIREVDPRGSASSARKSITLDRHLLNLSYRLVHTMGFEGIAMVEYKRSSNGETVLMEINGRPWGSIGLAIASGIDYPRYYIDWWLTRSLPPKTIAYETNVTCRRVVGELTHLMNVRNGKPESWPTEYPNFWTTLAKIAVPWYPGMHYDDLWISDPRPTLAQIQNWFRVRRKS